MYKYDKGEEFFVEKGDFWCKNKYTQYAIFEMAVNVVKMSILYVLMFALKLGCFWCFCINGEIGLFGSLYMVCKCYYVSKIALYKRILNINIIRLGLLTLFGAIVTNGRF